MDKKAAKRVDALYRNVKTLPVLGLIGMVVPIIGIMLLPITLAYRYLNRQLLRDCASGRIKVEKHDRVSAKAGEPSTQQKLEFLRNGDSHMRVPAIVGSVWLALILCIVIYVSLL